MRKVSVMRFAALSIEKSVRVRSPTTSNASPSRTFTVSLRGVCEMMSSPMNSSVPSASSIL